MAENLIKGYVLAVKEEAGFGEGSPRTETDASSARTVASPVDLVGVVQESTVKVVNDTTSFTLVIGTDYTVTVSAGVTTVTFIAGTNFTDSDLCTITYGIWEDSDVLITDTGSYMSTEISELERDTANGSFVGCPSLSGTETSSGTITSDVLIKTDGKFNNHLLMKSGLGKYVVDGANFVASAQGTMTASDTDVVIYGALNTADLKVYVGTDNTGVLLTEGAGNDYTAVDNSNGSITVTVLIAGTAVDTDNLYVESPNSFAISEVATGTGSGQLYKFSKPTDDQVSLALRQYSGGSVDNVKDFNGIVPNSVAFTLSAGELAKVAVDLGGTETEPASIAQGSLVGAQCGDAFAVKKAVFMKNGVVQADAQDITFTSENTVADISGVEGDGVTRKVVTAKMFTGSFTILLNGTANLQAFKNNEDGSIFFNLANTQGDKFAIYLPKIRFTGIDESDVDGVAGEPLDYKAFEDDLGNACYVYSDYRA